jgi:murein DD-endopeptidase MepM/ murein hydrolase activator NlpD
MAAAGRNAALARRIMLVLPLALACQACGKPAKVVLYEDRHQIAQRGVRDVQAPVPAPKPGAHTAVTREVIAGPGAQAQVQAQVQTGARTASRGSAIEVSSLPPPPGVKPDRATSAEVASSNPTEAPPAAKPAEVQIVTNTAPAAGTAKAYAKTADATDQYRKIPPDGIHVVTPKQTVYALSRLYGVPVRSLIQLNKLEPPYLLQTGQKVKIPVQRTHVVAAGETVYAISRRYDVSLTELVRLNEIGKPFTIVTGQTLLLPDEQRTDVATAAPETGKPETGAPETGAGEMEAVGDADELAKETPSAGAPAAPDPPGQEQVASVTPPAAKRVVLPPSTDIPHPKSLSGSGFLWPVNGKVISRFGVKGKGLRNDGINIAAPSGAPIRAAQNGVVAYRGNELRGFGNLILIKHDKGYMTAYAHASKILVERGARVKRGDVIARVGKTGSVGEHQLHFEIRRGRQPIDPLNYLQRDRAELPDEPAAPKG